MLGLFPLFISFQNNSFGNQHPPKENCELCCWYNLEFMRYNKIEMFSVPCSYIPFDAQLFQLWPMGAPLAPKSFGRLQSWAAPLILIWKKKKNLQIHRVHFLPLTRNQSFLNRSLVPSNVSPLHDNPGSRLQPRLELLIPSGRAPLACAPAARKSWSQWCGLENFCNVFLCSHQVDRKGGSPDMGKMVRQ